MFRIILCCCLAIFVCSSCKKEKEEVPRPVPQTAVYPDFGHLQPGNYWIYQTYMVDSDGNATPTTLYDSIYAGPERVLNGKTYQCRMEPEVPGSTMYIPRFFRDSLRYKVSESGSIEFDPLDFNQIFSSSYFIQYGDTVAFITYQMTDRDLEVTVPAGSFKTYTKSDIWYMRGKYQAGGAVRKLTKRYNIDIGIVSESTYFYASSDLTPERRLVRYYVK